MGYKTGAARQQNRRIITGGVHAKGADRAFNAQHIAN
jgi:hypothetical protein